MFCLVTIPNNSQKSIYIKMFTRIRAEVRFYPFSYNFIHMKWKANYSHHARCLICMNLNNF